MVLQYIEPLTSSSFFIKPSQFPQTDRSNIVLQSSNPKWVKGCSVHIFLSIINGQVEKSNKTQSAHSLTNVSVGTGHLAGHARGGLVLNVSTSQHNMEKGRLRHGSLFIYKKPPEVKFIRPSPRSLLQVFKAAKLLMDIILLLFIDAPDFNRFCFLFSY